MEILRELNFVSIIFRVFLSLIFGGVIGLERSRKKRPAGFRTYMLVCLSSALVMMTNQFIFSNFGGSDPARLGGQVISGIGFLGAGTIIVTSRSQVRGLTTAAGLWASACLGIAIGIGFYEGAVLTGLFVIVIMTFFKTIDKWLISTNKNITIYASFDSMQSLDGFMALCSDLGLKVNDMEINKNTGSAESLVIVILNFESRERHKHVEIIQRLSSYEGLGRLEEL